VSKGRIGIAAKGKFRLQKEHGGEINEGRVGPRGAGETDGDLERMI